MIKAYYNENDKKVAAALRQLISDGLIMAGDVDDRPIQEVKASDLQGYTRHHFFAGIAGWELALQMAGWPDDLPVWTGSCPCQPFSTAGKRKGKNDERHLWPFWFHLIKDFRPNIIFGEQVSSAISHGWWDDVADDLEAENYATWAAVLPACSVGAPHKRERLWFVGYSEHAGWDAASKLRGYGAAISNDTQGADSASKFAGASSSGNVAWSSGEWILCPDGKQRLIEPSIQLLANGIPERVALLRAAGNAIVPQVAAAFIKAATNTIVSLNADLLDN